MMFTVIFTKKVRLDIDYIRVSCYTNNDNESHYQR